MHRPVASLAAVVTLSCAAAVAAQPAPTFTSDDVLAVRTFAGGQPVAVSPTGRWIAYVLTDMNDEWNIQEPRPSGHVVVQTLGNDRPGPPRAFTTGTTHSSFPAWSPDGRRLAFIRDDQSGGRLIVWDADRDVLTPLGELFTTRAYLAPQWEPSGRSLIVAVPVPERQAQPYRVRVVKNTDARIPGDRFFTDERRAQLTAIDVTSGKASPLVSDPIVLRSFRLSPTGRDLLFVSPDPATLGVIGREQNDTFVLPIAGARPATARKLSERGRFTWSPDGTRVLFAKGGRLLTMAADGGPAGLWRESFTLSTSEPVWSPDGTRFTALVADPTITDPEIEPVRPGMYTIAQPFMDLYVVAADGVARNVTGSFDDQISDPVWAPDGSAVYFRATSNKTYDETLYKYSVADEKLRPVARGQESYGRLTPIKNGVLLPIEDATHPDDLWFVDDRGDNRRMRVTNLNPQLSRFTFSKPEMFWYFNGDGDRLGALLYKPAGLQRVDKVPVITWVYEKMTPALHRFNARDQMFISHGYAMLMPNVKIKVGQAADSYEKCVVPAVNAVRQMGFTGPFGLWGHSFGAYATSNLITRTNIFAAAVSGATPPELFRNWASGRDRDSRNIETGQARMGGSPFEYPERYRSQSAFFRLDKVNTPVLILHGEKDLTILFGEGEMMFYALRQLGKTAEFVAYANGDHSLSRHSKADFLDVNRRILEWFDRYLKMGDSGRTQ
jgi:dipeptidyl aminopeptidase/acylaminoacyl peptidase